jgi:hypothetical protein
MTSRHLRSSSPRSARDSRRTPSHGRLLFRVAERDGRLCERQMTGEHFPDRIVLGNASVETDLTAAFQLGVILATLVRPTQELGLVCEPRVPSGSACHSTRSRQRPPQTRGQTTIDVKGSACGTSLSDLWTMRSASLWRAQHTGAQTGHQGSAGPVGACLAVMTPPAAVRFASRSIPPPGLNWRDPRHQRSLVTQKFQQSPSAQPEPPGHWKPHAPQLLGSVSSRAQ